MIKRDTSVPCQYSDSYNGGRCDNIAPHPSIHPSILWHYSP